MPDVNRRQAMVPRRSAWCSTTPTARRPGLMIEHDDRVVVLLPGPPRELKPMFDALCDELLGARTAASRIYRRSIFVAGRGESHVEEIAQPIYSRWTKEMPRIETTILGDAGAGRTASDASRRPQRKCAKHALCAARDELAGALGDDVFSTDGRSMEEVVGALLRDRGLTISAAESCTGGLLMTSR